MHSFHNNIKRFSNALKIFKFFQSRRQAILMCWSILDWKYDETWTGTYLIFNMCSSVVLFYLQLHPPDVSGDISHDAFSWVTDAKEITIRFYINCVLDVGWASGTNIFYDDIDNDDYASFLKCKANHKGKWVIWKHCDATLMHLCKHGCSVCIQGDCRKKTLSAQFWRFYFLLSVLRLCGVKVFERRRVPASRNKIWWILEWKLGSETQGNTSNWYVVCTQPISSMHYTAIWMEP